MKYRNILCTLCAASFITSVILLQPCGAEQAPRDILRKADLARGNVDGISWDLTVLALEDGRTNSMTVQVQARGYDVLAQTMAPPKHKGDKLLVLKNNMWFHKRDLSKPVPISQRQKLMGNAAYGDIATTNYAEDYEPTPLPDESVNGEDCFVFDLLARTKKTTYDRIRYWISKARTVAVKANYYTVSGKKFKSAVMEYMHKVEIAGEQDRPFISKMTISDELMSSNVTQMVFSPPVLKKMPDHIFDLNFLTR
jgi:hypothetical protein